MFNHYLKIAWRNLFRSRGFSFLNISGLAVGMAVAMLIGLWVMDEMNFDSTHEKSDHIYQTYIVDYKSGGTESMTYGAVPLPVADALRKNYPEVKYAAESDFGWNHSLVKGDKRFFKLGMQVHGDFLKIFTYPLLVGDAETALDDPYSIVLTESMAQAIFDVEPGEYEGLLQETVWLDDRVDVKITGVIADPPDNNTHQFEYLIPFSNWETWANWVTEARTNWGNNSFKVFIELHEGTDEKLFAEKVKTIIQDNQPKSDDDIVLHPMKKWRLYSEWENGKAESGFIQYVKLFGTIGFFVLLIACINFMNLSTARSEKRAKEVGIRKTVGSGRGQLIGQFLGETFLMVLVAFALSVALVEFALPWFNDLTVKEMSVPYTHPLYIASILSFLLLTGLLAGGYPAFFLSGFKPIGVLKSVKTKVAGNHFRKLLVVTQFTVSVALIIGTIVIWQQVQHAKERDTGYNAQKLISVFASSDLVEGYDILKKELMETGMVETMTRSSAPVTSVYANMGNVTWPGRDPDDELGFALIATIENYTKTIDVDMVEGRDFTEGRNDSTSVIFNQAAIKRMGLEDPLGQQIKWDGYPYTIVGVMEDILMESPFTPIRPAMFIYAPDWFDQIVFRLKPEADVSETLATIEPIFNRLNPSYPFKYKFVDEEYGRKFESVNMMGTLATVFGVLAIFISCLGLFGLAAYMAERRTKEIGIRKVLGATTINLWSMLSKEFLLLVLVASLIAVPLAFYYMDGWLEQYEYRIEMNAWVFFTAIVIAISVTLFTVSFQSIKAALANPINALRNE